MRSEFNSRQPERIKLLNMVSLQLIVSILAVILTFVGYVPYIRDTLKGKTKPHAFTWFIWALAGGTAWGLQVFGGAGIGSWPLLSAVILCFVIFILSLRIGDKDITKSDVVFLVLSIVALFLWLGVHQPVWSVILATSVEVLGFAPTIRKSWNKPYSETLFSFEMASFRHGISIIALQQFNILTLLYPIAWTFANFIFVVILIIRRKVIPPTE